MLKYHAMNVPANCSLFLIFFRFLMLFLQDFLFFNFNLLSVLSILNYLIVFSLNKSYI